MTSLLPTTTFNNPLTNYTQNTDIINNYCSQHPSNNFVYICMAENCLKPVCIDCEQSHSFQHENTGTSENYISFSEHLRKQSETLRILMQKAKNIKINIMGQLKGARQKYLKIVNDHFDALDKEARQINTNDKFLQELNKNYKDLHSGKNYNISQYVKDEKLPEFVENLENFEDLFKKSIIITPGIQIMTNNTNMNRKRHCSQNLQFSKAHWVDKKDIQEKEKKEKDMEVKSHKSHGDVGQDRKMTSTQKLAFIMKKDKSQKTQTQKQLKLNSANANKSFQIKDQKQEDTLNFRNGSKTISKPDLTLPKVPITPIQFSKHRANIQDVLANPQIVHEGK